MNSSTEVNLNIQPGYEPITGYKLEQLIGRGGFGEVWRSEAPGGLHKAVKFVYGATDEQRAQRELRSLERIKGVHHPFLLTLERFGVIDGRLVIVTELADGSLEDVFKRHLERGSCGIPRVSLLSYLHDAADALDYLHRKYQLQHLDIKPGNLLLIGGHAKVADFGLLKDLRDEDCSMVGGLTPVYAPPELFDGRPSMHSDQYSLAVMYQELLTGTRPFAGRTIAQLATQHVHTAPNLNPLPPGDRPIVARALEKDPGRRYPSCTEFIDALRAAAGKSTPQFNGPATLDGDTSTGMLDASSAKLAVRVQDLPQLKLASPRVGVRITSHALVIAIGGRGARVLQMLRARVASHRAACPLDLHSILIDTDHATIQAAKIAEHVDGVPVCRSLHTPLKNAIEYRDYKGSKYKSISRRWLFNVPRSGTTEAMRPLGRLALIDHADEVKRQLQEAILHLSAVSGDTAPTVYIVGSTDGGTASGMILDIVHLARHILDDYSMAHVPVLPIFLMGTMNRDSKNPLGTSDSAALLTEMKFFLNPANRYPGDVAVDWPSVPSARTPLADAYVIGAGLPDELIADPCETACEYIWVDSSNAKDFLGAARAIDDSHQTPSSSRGHVRSVGVVRLRTPRLLEENLIAPSVVRRLLGQWLGDPVEAKKLPADRIQKLMRRCGLSSDMLAGHALGIWEASKRDRTVRLKQVIDEMPFSVRRVPASLQSKLKELAEQTLGSTGDALLSTCFNSLYRDLTVQMVDGKSNVAIALETLDQVAAILQRSLDEANQGMIDGVVYVEPTPPDPQAPLAQHAEHWLSRVICSKVIDFVTQALNGLQELKDLVSDRGATLVQCLRMISDRLNGDDDKIFMDVDPEIRKKVEPLVPQLRSSLTTPVLGIHSLLRASDALDAASLLQSLLDSSLRVICHELGNEGEDANSTTNSGMSTLNEQLRWDDPAQIAEALDSVKPKLLQCGGYQRMLLIVGSEAERLGLEPRFREIHRGPLTTAVVPGSVPMLICEAQQIDLTDLCNRIITLGGGDEDVMARLASRNDIDWRNGSACLVSR